MHIPADIETRWLTAWSTLDLAAPEGALRTLLVRYGEPHRAYHTLQHLRECFAFLDEVGAGLQHPAAVAIALFYHDAVYKPSRSDNEAVSAQLAAHDLEASGAPSELVQRVTALIMDTTHRTPPTSLDGAVLVDIDLAILGAAPSRFAQYERDIRREYRWVPGPLYRRRRSAVLRAFLARSPLYANPLLRDRFEGAAKRNLAASIAALESR